MGKVTGFLEIDRQVAKYQPASDRFVAIFGTYCFCFNAITLAILSVATDAKSKEITQVEKNCVASPRCVELLNQKPDFNYVEAKVVEIIDADTMKLEIFLWPQQTVTTSVRLKGIDTPELNDAKCLKEKLLSEEAKTSIEQKFPVGSWVLVSDVVFDKYGGRYVADVKRWLSDRLKSASDELLENERWAVPYDGGAKIHNWCS
ncbi:MAG: hypothetical protein WCC66_09230 [Rhizobiaceae bacterium]